MSELPRYLLRVRGRGPWRVLRDLEHARNAVEGLRRYHGRHVAFEVLELGTSRDVTEEFSC